MENDINRTDFSPFSNNVGGGPTDDRPEVRLATRADLNKLDTFLNLRVADTQPYDED